MWGAFPFGARGAVAFVATSNRWNGETTQLGYGVRWSASVLPAPRFRGSWIGPDTPQRGVGSCGSERRASARPCLELTNSLAFEKKRSPEA